MKKFISTLIMVAMLISMLSTVAFADTYRESKIGFVLDSKVQTWDEKTYGSMFVKDGRTFIPLRVVSEKLGYTVKWNAKTNSADIEKGDTKISFTIGKKEVTTAKGVVTLDVASFTKNGRTYVPMRGLFEAIGMEVRWLSSKVTAQELKTSITNMKSDFYVVVGGESSTATTVPNSASFTSTGEFNTEAWNNIIKANVPDGQLSFVDNNVVLVGEDAFINSDLASLNIVNYFRSNEVHFIIQGWGEAGVQATLKSGLQSVSKTTADGTAIFNIFYDGMKGKDITTNKWLKAGNTQYLITTEGIGTTIKVKTN